MPWLAKDPNGLAHEIEHEFFHSWNLVAIRPAGYNDLSYRPPARTPALWLGEGVTLYYSDVVPRRAHLADSAPSRLARLGDLLHSYYAAPSSMRVSPARASLAFGDSPVVNADATGGYYMQGELLADALDARLRDSTHEARGLDDVLRALYARSQTRGYHGFTSPDVRATVDSVCVCKMSQFFDDEVDGVGPIDIRPLLSRIGLGLVIDSVPPTDSTGRPLPDLRLFADYTAPPDVVRLVITDPATAWAVAGLRTGDDLVALDGAPIRSRDQLRTALRTIRLGDTAVVDVRRDGAPVRLTVRVTGYVQPRVRFVDLPTVTPDQQKHRQRWLAGW